MPIGIANYKRAKKKTSRSIKHGAHLRAYTV